MSQPLLTLCVACLVAAGGPAVAQAPGDRLDVEPNPDRVEALQPGSVCFPMFDQSVRVGVVVFESVAGREYGDPPQRKPRPDVEATLVARLQHAYVHCDVAARDNGTIQIEVMLLAEPVNGKMGRWAVITTWSGLNGGHAAGAACGAAMRVEHTGNIDEAVSHIVELMTSGHVATAPASASGLPN